MNLNPDTSSLDRAFASDAKASINIHAFNGNTTNFNRCPNPTPKTVPVQPRQELPMPLMTQHMMRPM
jgi:hypothetical protein